MPMPSCRLSAALLTGTCLTLLAGCAGSSDTAGAHGPAAASAIPVVASTNVYGDLARRIGGAKVQVTSIISDPDQDPHSYEASARNQLALSKAEVVIENGGGYDDFVDRMLKSAGSSPDVINAVEVSGKTAPKGGELNEHVWYDFPTVAELAERIAAALGEADPADAAAFTQNAKDFVRLLRPLERKEARIKAEHGGEAVAITEPVALYMIEAGGLRNATPEEFSEAIEEGDDVSPRTLRSTLALFTGKKVEALVYNEQTSGPQTEKAERAAEAAGIPVVPVTETLPKGRDYLAWMTANVDALASALAK
ncbi:metal ABC transporter solute-binding protein, Zn/Mn family [Streptomyces sp. Tu102]|uniref:metal ABC transporter solute-binding protein, Zn/Mn family n=1 Tax=Streptomyces sp. Tu102 TaxID=2838019 RepID=UPI001BDCC36C|nr:zinc ABC transporter substrate-binding protein [Streptomyces sp. Tu102]MBT1090010.1 zinc ABC transporter substrate-binding protein [Streptomyces sp. Tu102]